MARISIDNGNTFYSGGQERALSDYVTANWDQIVEFMDDDARERAHSEFNSGDVLDFLNLYLSIAKNDLVMP